MPRGVSPWGSMALGLHSFMAMMPKPSPQPQAQVQGSCCWQQGSPTGVPACLLYKGNSPFQPGPKALHTEAAFKIVPLGGLHLLDPCSCALWGSQTLPMPCTDPDLTLCLAEPRAGQLLATLEAVGDNTVCSPWHPKGAGMLPSAPCTAAATFPHGGSLNDYQQGRESTPPSWAPGTSMVRAVGTSSPMKGKDQLNWAVMVPGQEHPHCDHEPLMAATGQESGGNGGHFSPILLNFTLQVSWCEGPVKGRSGGWQQEPPTARRLHLQTSCIFIQPRSLEEDGEGCMMMLLVSDTTVWLKGSDATDRPR